jgi:hypothetical protein
VTKAKTSQDIQRSDARLALTNAQNGRLYAGAWQSRVPAPYALPSVDLMAGFRDDMSGDAINMLPMTAYEGPVYVVRAEEELEEAMDALRRESIFGFDTETRPQFRKGASNQVALLQLAGAGAVWLIQLTRVGFGPALAELLADPRRIKAGVAIHDDMRGLARMHPFIPAGVADLGLMARRLGLTTVGLRSLSANLLGFRISKSVQCSNWERDMLEPRQVRYAATDAWLGRELYLRLLGLGGLAPVPFVHRKPV